MHKLQAVTALDVYGVGSVDTFPWGAGHETLRVTRTGEQAGKALRSQGHHYARVM